ncbi:P-loop containing nucleoside triphosphate hydrolase protein [Coprinellus micaceus]|uniref:Signal recognition particle receptor subunit beta n=1 Tax=Coprinellus micaceus TaxID=71717 RepID=A0A4Y7SVL8_COPMI|nr:P-loop containing nucleoside triphosphate hydrolase protein [Coprinellus micaceus]
MAGGPQSPPPDAPLPEVTLESVPPVIPEVLPPSGLLALISKSRGNALLLTGPMDSGKTAIFSRLAYTHSLPTLTSLQTNSSTISLSPSKNVRVVDVPGHPRIRGQCTEHLGDAKVLAFVVDSNTISRNGAAVAEHLHTILHSLTSLPPSQTPPQLLILCNKADMLGKNSTGSSTSTLAINRVRTILERELEKRRVSTAGGVAVEGLGEDEGDGGEGTDGNAPFRFEEWEGGEVVFLGTSAKPVEGGDEKKDGDEKSEAEDGGLAELKDWLEENM